MDLFTHLRDLWGSHVGTACSNHLSCDLSYFTSCLGDRVTEVSHRKRVKCCYVHKLGAACIFNSLVQQWWKPYRIIYMSSLCIFQSLNGIVSQSAVWKIKRKIHHHFSRVACSSFGPPWGMISGFIDVLIKLPSLFLIYTTMSSPWTAYMSTGIVPEELQLNDHGHLRGGYIFSSICLTIFFSRFEFCAKCIIHPPSSLLRSGQRVLSFPPHSSSDPFRLSLFLMTTTLPSKDEFGELIAYLPGYSYLLTEPDRLHVLWEKRPGLFISEGKL